MSPVQRNIWRFSQPQAPRKDSPREPTMQRLWKNVPIRIPLESARDDSSEWEVLQLPGVQYCIRAANFSEQTFT